MATIRKQGEDATFIDDLAAAIAERVRARIIAAVDEAFAQVSGPSEGSVQKGRPARAKRRALSPAMARARKVQGQYLGALRSLTGDARKKVKALAQSEGVGRALALARSLAKK
jgi:hypothetical protein